LPKGEGDISAGEALRWDTAASVAGSDGDIPLGYAAEAAGEGDATVKVLLDRSAGRAEPQEE